MSNIYITANASDEIIYKEAICKQQRVTQILVHVSKIPLCRFCLESERWEVLPHSHPIPKLNEGGQIEGNTMNTMKYYESHLQSGFQMATECLCNKMYPVHTTDLINACWTMSQWMDKLPNAWTVEGIARWNAWKQRRRIKLCRKKNILEIGNHVAQKANSRELHSCTLQWQNKAAQRSLWFHISL